MLTLYSWFFMFGGSMAILMGIINFFNPFPSNTIPFISVGFTLIVSILYGHAKLGNNPNSNA